MSSAKSRSVPVSRSYSGHVHDLRGQACKGGGKQSPLRFNARPPRTSPSARKTRQLPAYLHGSDSFCGRLALLAPSLARNSYFVPLAQVSDARFHPHCKCTAPASDLHIPAKPSPKHAQQLTQRFPQLGKFFRLIWASCSPTVFSLQNRSFSYSGFSRPTSCVFPRFLRSKSL